MFANLWPEMGRIDIIEGVNQQSVNTMALYTSTGCVVENYHRLSRNPGEHKRTARVQRPGDDYELRCERRGSRTERWL